MLQRVRLRGIGMNVVVSVGSMLCSVVSTTPARATEYDEEIQITATRRQEPAAKVSSAITVIDSSALDAATPQTVTASPARSCSRPRPDKAS
jgi:outer membrane receptor protein involved in Fe transport